MMHTLATFDCSTTSLARRQRKDAADEVFWLQLYNDAAFIGLDRRQLG
jgi:hypothetical protein